MIGYICWVIIMMFWCTSAYGYTVALDIGHFANKGGAKGYKSGINEYVFNKNIVDKVNECLYERGIGTFIVDDKFKLKERPRVASNYADLYISIHHDALSKRELFKRNVVSGYSIFLSKYNSDYSTSVKFAQVLGKELKDNGFKPNYYYVKRKDAVSPESGIYRFDKLVVLRLTKIPAVLLECGVIANPKEEANFLKPETQWRMAIAICNSVGCFMERGK
jgi:N-acetylmuramoyl-L-alanine amidase